MPLSWIEFLGIYIWLVQKKINAEAHRASQNFITLQPSYFGELFNLLLGQISQYDISYLYFLIFCSACRPKESGSLLNQVYIYFMIKYHKVCRQPSN